VLRCCYCVGSLDTPWKYVIATGLVGLSCIPYTSSTGTTGTCPALNSDSVPTCTTTGYTNTAYQSGSCYQLKTVASMQAEILTYGSVVAGIHHTRHSYILHITLVMCNNDMV
jgi:hypothetical protein